MRTDVVAALLFAAFACPAMAQSSRSIAGIYICQAGCRITDANPGVEIHGNVANCMNELGGIYRGKVLTKNSIACFNKVGALSEDGKTIRWDSGMVWRRLSPPP
jgi:hypothetical protein